MRTATRNATRIERSAQRTMRRCYAQGATSRGLMGSSRIPTIQVASLARLSAGAPPGVRRMARSCHPWLTFFLDPLLVAGCALMPEDPEDPKHAEGPERQFEDRKSTRLNS